MATERYDEQLKILKRAALLASEQMLAVAESGRAIASHRKEGNSLVTELDLAAQATIVRELGRALPIVAEEDPSSHGVIRSADEYYLVDPLDGTTSCRRFLSAFGGQVGYGPILGYVRNGRIEATVFVNILARSVFWASSGGGSWCVPLRGSAETALDSEREPSRLKPELSRSLIDSAILFLPSGGGEAEFAEYLRCNDLVDNVYRFGGFANDVSRLCRGLEQIQAQFSVKSWDLSAALLAAEAGYDVIVDPFGKAVSLAGWRVAENNPLLICAPAQRDALLGALKRSKR